MWANLARMTKIVLLVCPSKASRITVKCGDQKFSANKLWPVSL